MRQRLSEIAALHPRIVLFVGLSIVYAATASYRAISIDVAAAEGSAWSLATRGTLDLSGARLRDLPWYFEHDGGLFSDRFPGAIFYLVPAYWLASLFGVADLSFAPGAITAAVVTALGVLFMRVAFESVLPTARVVWTATLVLAFGTGAWSIAANAPWSHTLDFLLIAAALAALSRDRLVPAGLLLGLAVTSRPTVAVGIAVLGLALTYQRRSWRPVISIGLSALPGMVLLFTYNGLMFGRWGASNGHELRGEIALRWMDLPANVVGALVSPSRGLLIFYPIILVALFTLRSAWKAAEDWERASALAGVAVLVTQLALNRYSGGDTFFGPRLMIEPLTFAAPLLARAVVGYARTRGTLVVRWMIVGGVMLHGAGAILLPY